MQLSSNLILGLWVASASAIDIYFWTDRGCRGSGVRYSNVNPGVCITGPDGYDFGVSFMGIPLNWNIACTSYLNRGCRDLMSSTHVRGLNYQCHDTSIYDSAEYTFLSKKRDEGEGKDICSAHGQACEPGAASQRGDTVVLHDGTMFDIGALPDDQWKEIVDASHNATSADDIPAKFQGLKSATKFVPASVGQ